MNSITRKLVLSILTVVLTVVALGTTTFAWFTLTNTAVIQPFESRITADTGIEVAIGQATVGEENALNWVTTLTTAQINTYLLNAYPSGFRYTHLTTTDGSTFYTLGIEDVAGTMVPVISSIPATGGWLEIPLNFRSNTANQILWSVVNLSSTERPFNADATYYNEYNNLVNSPQVYNITSANAVRIAVLGNLSPVVYELPASSSNVVLGAGGNLLDGMVAGVQISGVDQGDPGAMNYFFGKNNNVPEGADAVTVISSITALSSNPVVTLGSVPTSGNTYFGSITIRIWVEGWDANAYNAVLDDIIRTSFTFTGTTI